MQATLCRTTDVILDICTLHTLDEDYATTPLPAVQPRPKPIDEETLHTSFEAAISDRITAQYAHWSNVHAKTGSVLPASMTSNETTPLPVVALTGQSRWQFFTIVTCAALLLLMAGFDLMGLLVLHMR